MRTLPFWVVCNNPLDFPGKATARLWENGEPSGKVHVADTVAEVVAMLPPHLFFIPRSEGDDACIVGTWL